MIPENPSKQFEAISKTLKELFERIKKLTKDLTKDQVYLYPELHRQIEPKLKGFSPEEIVCIKGEGSIPEKEYRKILNDKKDQRKYHILTHMSEDSSDEQIQYLATKSIGELVSSMQDTYREERFKRNDKDAEIERLKNPNFGKNFDEINSELFLGEYGKIRFSKIKNVRVICEFLFKDKESIQEIWAIDDFVDIFEKLYSEEEIDIPIDMYKAVELKIRRINYRVKKHTKGAVDPLIQCSGHQVYVNPNYFYLFK